MIIVDKAEKTTINISKNSLGNTSFKDYATQQWVKSNYYDKEEVNEMISHTIVDVDTSELADGGFLIFRRYEI